MTTTDEPTEPDDAGGDHDVPPDLVELHEALEFQGALDEAAGQ